MTKCHVTYGNDGFKLQAVVIWVLIFLKMDRGREKTEAFAHMSAWTENSR